MKIDPITYFPGVGLTGYGAHEANETEVARRKSKRSLEIRALKSLREEEKKVQVVYDAHGKTVRRDEPGQNVYLLTESLFLFRS